jgi:hypothetical protein
MYFKRRTEYIRRPLLRTAGLNWWSPLSPDVVLTPKKAGDELAQNGKQCA